MQKVKEGFITDRKYRRIRKQIFNVPHLKWLRSKYLKVRECEYNLENNKVW